VLVIPGIVIGLGTITLAWWFARRQAGPAAGLLAAALVALSYSVIESDSTVRPYAALQLLLLAAVFLLWKAIAEGSRSALAGWVMTALLMAYSHHWTLLPLAAMGLAAVWLTVQGRSTLTLAPLLFGGLVVVLGWFPLLSQLLYQIRHAGHLPKPAYPLIQLAEHLLYRVPGYVDGHALVAWAGVAGVLLLRRDAAPLERGPRLALTLLGGTVALAMVLAVIGSFGSNMLVAHTESMLTPLVLVSFACVLARPVEQGALLAKVATILVLSMSGIDAARIATSPRTNVDLIAEYVSRQATRDDLVLVVPVTAAPSVLRYYRGTARLAGYHAGYITSPIDFNDRVARDTTAEALGRVPILINQTLERGGRIWQITSEPPGHLLLPWSRFEADMVRRAGDPVQIIAGRYQTTLDGFVLRVYGLEGPTISRVQ